MAMRSAKGSGPSTADVAFEELFRAVWPRSVIAARRIVGPEGDAEALAAEALTRAYDRWSSVRRHPAPEAWVLRVTINLALDRVRRQPRPVAGALAGRPTAESVVQPFDEATAVRLALCEALRQLPDRQRQAIALRYLGGCVEEDIAASMKISPGSVKTHLKRGLSRLRAQEGIDPEANLALAP